MITCPVCGAKFSRVNHTHCTSHGMTVPEWQTLRLEAEHGRPITNILTDIYVDQYLTTPDIFARYGITFRMLRALLSMHGIPMRTRSDVAKITWAKDDGTRAQATRIAQKAAWKKDGGILAKKASERMKEAMKHVDFSGKKNPAKRPDVRRKISEAKQRNNPGLMPMLLSSRELRLANPSSLESAMITALNEVGIIHEREHQVGRYFVDIAFSAIHVAVECDGKGWHETKTDAARDSFLQAQGWRVFRFSQIQIQADARQCVQDLIADLHALGLNPPTREQDGMIAG